MEPHLACPVVLTSMLGLSLIRQWIERRAVRVDLGEALPDYKAVSWGWCSGIPFFQVRLPSWSYELNIRRQRYELMQLVVAWSGVRGWFTYYR